MTSPTRVLVVGLDAMDADIARNMAASGRLPTIASLLDTAASAETINPPGLFVGGVWPSFATGTSPARHGLYGWRQLIPGAYSVGRVDSHDVKRPPFWSALSDAGLCCAVIDPPLMPVAAGGADLQVVDWGSHDGFLPFETWPPEIADEITARVGAHPIAGKADDYAERGDYAGLRRDLLEGVESKRRLTEHFLARGGWDLFVTVFGESHCAGHLFWHFHDPAHPDHEPDLLERLGDPLEEVYAELDGALGRLLAAIGDDTVVFVLLSHGMGPHYDGDHLLDEILRRIETADHPPRRGVVMRERLIRAGRRVGRAIRRPARAGVVSLDGSRRFYRVPNNEAYAGVRINLAGREPRGQVQPGRELDGVSARLRDDLLDLRNIETEQPVFTEVLRTSDVYEGEAMDGLPDLCARWARDAPIRAVGSPKIGTVRGAYSGPRRGDHRAPGLLLARGPSITPGPLSEQVRVEDLSATIARLLGLRLEDVDGRPVERLAEVGVPTPG